MTDAETTRKILIRRATDDSLSGSPALGFPWILVFVEFVFAYVRLPLCQCTSCFPLPINYYIFLGLFMHSQCSYTDSFTDRSVAIHGQFRHFWQAT